MILVTTWYIYNTRQHLVLYYQVQYRPLKHYLHVCPISRHRDHYLPAPLRPGMRMFLEHKSNGNSSMIPLTQEPYWFMCRKFRKTLGCLAFCTLDYYSGVYSYKYYNIEISDTTPTCVLACPDLEVGRSPPGPTRVHGGYTRPHPRQRGALRSLLGELLVAWGGGGAFYLQPQCRGVHSKSRGGAPPQRTAQWVRHLSLIHI